MKKLIIIPAFLLILTLFACNKGESGEIAETTPTTTSSESPATTPANEPDEPTCPEGKTLYQWWHDETIFRLYGMIPEDNIYLYGIAENGGMVLSYKNEGTYFKWNSPVLYELSKMLYYDFDGCGKKEIAVINTHNRGTGCWLDNLHILKIEENDWGRIAFSEFSIITEYWDYKDNVKGWLIEPSLKSVAQDGESFIIEFLGKEYVVESFGAAKSIDYGEVVYFVFSDNKIEVVVSVGAMYEDSTSPMYFAAIAADVIFTGDGFKLENYSFAMY